MDTLAVILISLLILWVVFSTMSIDDNVGDIKHELYEIQLILSYYIKEKLKREREKGE